MCRAPEYEGPRIHASDHKTTDFLHSPNEIVEPNAYLDQLTNSEDKTQVGNTYGLVKKIAAHSFTFTYRSGKCKDETQVT